MHCCNIFKDHDFDDYVSYANSFDTCSLAIREITENPQFIGEFKIKEKSFYDAFKVKMSLLIHSIGVPNHWKLLVWTKRSAAGTSLSLSTLRGITKDAHTICSWIISKREATFYHGPYKLVAFECFVNISYLMPRHIVILLKSRKVLLEGWIRWKAGPCS